MHVTCSRFHIWYHLSYIYHVMQLVHNVHVGAINSSCMLCTLPYPLLVWNLHISQKPFKYIYIPKCLRRRHKRPMLDIMWYTLGHSAHVRHGRSTNFSMSTTRKCENNHNTNFQADHSHSFKQFRVFVWKMCELTLPWLKINRNW